MEKSPVGVKNNPDKNVNQNYDEVEKIQEPVEGYFKAGENTVVNLNCKTKKLARILEEKSNIEKSGRD
ncbi:MAG TPA: hypothetical protein GXX35_04365 [Thermoanaerobacterales bacterium]|nr:hypothetical protein [Thermoanaerobacterales bacterium]